MTRFTITISLMTALLTHAAAADWELRKTFSGTDKDKTAPAAFSVVRGTGGDYHNLDVALKYKHNPPDQEETAFFVTPSIELHRNTSDGKSEKHQRVFGLALNHQHYSTTSERLWVSNLSYSVSNDRKADTRARSFALVMGPYWPTSSFGPGQQFEWGERGETFFVYTLSGGARRIADFDVKEGQGAAEQTHSDLSAEFWETNVTANIYPFAEFLAARGDSRLIVTASYRSLRRYSGPRVVPRSSEMYSVSVDYYFEESRNFSVGIDHEKGRDNATNFRSIEKTTLGLKLKI